MTPEPAAPAYEGGSLADAVPMAALSLGAESILDVAQRERAERLAQPIEARAVVLVLIDGLGLELLRAHGAHAPFLRQAFPRLGQLTAGFPSTTANSLSSLGTGLAPGGHGVVGYRLLDPERDAVFNQLSWDGEADPRAWVPDPTLFERLESSGVEVVSLGEPKFARRGLNAASLRGGRFIGSGDLDRRVDDALAELRSPGRRLIYLYWGALDRIGHGHGSRSWAWLEELERIDAQLGRLADALPAGTRMLLTADHGMVDVDHENRLDLAEHPELRSGLRHVGGEPRAVHLYAEPGAEADLEQAWRESVGERGMVIGRGDAIRAGLFGPVVPRARARMGDVLVIAQGSFSVVDAENDSASVLGLIGHHGGLSSAELLVPLMSFDA